MLREPRARYLSQYLHLKQYGEAYLRVRACAMRHASAESAHVGKATADARCTRQGEHPKWPGELRHMRITPHEGVPPLATLLAGKSGRERCATVLQLGS